MNNLYNRKKRYRVVGPARIQRALTLLILLIAAVLAAACGTLNVTVDEPPADVSGSNLTEPTPLDEQGTQTGNLAEVGDESPRMPVEIMAWYGTFHTIPGSEPGHDYFKPWHLNIWPKYGPAVGITGENPSLNAEIERLRDSDIKATVWGGLTCDVGDYGGCQLLVTRITASDGGPSFVPDMVDSWEGTIGALPAQPGSQEEVLFFELPGQVPALYGVSSEDPGIQLELERLKDSGHTVHIWGELRSRAQPVTSSLIVVEKLEAIGDG